MNSTCPATKRDGSPCTLPSNSSSGLCWAHDPKNAEQRRRGQSRGGRKKPSRELQELKGSIREVIEAVRDGSLERSVGAVLFQGYNTLLKAAETERRWYETQVLEARIEELEEAYQKRRHTAAWG